MAQDSVRSVALAIVTDNVDPSRRGRVRITLPSSGPDENVWARLVRPLGVPGNAAVMPRIGEEVVVAFDHGDTRAPLVIGKLWNGSED